MLRADTTRAVVHRAMAVIVLITLAVATGACTHRDGASPSVESAPSAAGPRNGGRLVFAVAQDAGGWNPVVDAWSRPALQIARALFDPLATYDDSNQLQPELAESITPNPDFTEWTITLRDGALFADGSPVDAAAVQRNLEAQRTSPLAREWFEPVKSIFVTGPRTVNVLMKTAWASFPHLLTGQAGYIAAPSMLDDPAGSSRPVGSGPFMLQSWTPGVALTAVKNSTYRRQGLPRLDEVDFRIVADPRERTDALMAGRVDVISTDDPEQISHLGREQVTGAVQLSVDRDGEAPKVMVALNAARAPFIDFDSRRAVTLATNRRQISQVVTDGVYEPIKGPVSPTSPWFADVVVPDADVSRSRELVAQYRTRYGRALTFKLLVAPDPIDLGVAARWQRQLTDAGIVVELVPTERADIDTATRRGEFDAALVEGFGTWHPDHTYPALHQSSITPLGVDGPNITRFGTDSTDKSLDEARRTDDLVRQVNEYRNVQSELVGGMSYVFILRVSEAVAARPDVRELTSWVTSSGVPGLGLDGMTVSLTHVWLDRPTPPTE